MQYCSRRSSSRSLPPAQVSRSARAAFPFGSGSSALITAGLQPIIMESTRGNTISLLIIISSSSDMNHEHQGAGISSPSCTTSLAGFSECKYGQFVGIEDKQVLHRSRVTLKNSSSANILSSFLPRFTVFYPVYIVLLYIGIRRHFQFFPDLKNQHHGSINIRAVFVKTLYFTNYSHQHRLPPLLCLFAAHFSLQEDFQ